MCAPYQGQRCTNASNQRVESCIVNAWQGHDGHLDFLPVTILGAIVRPRRPYPGLVLRKDGSNGPSIRDVLGSPGLRMYGGVRYLPPLLLPVLQL